MVKFLYKMRCKENLPFYIFALFLIIIHYKIHLVSGSDDDFMSTAINTGNFTQLYANNRVVLNFFGAYIMHLPLIIWKVLNITVIILLIAKIMQYAAILSTYSSTENNILIIWGICFLFFLLPFNVLSSGVFWITGSFNYLWGICGSLFISIIFIKDLAGIQIRKKELIFGLLLGIYACDVEQSMVIVCLSGIIYLFYCFFNHKRINREILFYGLILILECMPIIFLPFNSHRALGEQGLYFPDFGMLSFWDKTYQGTMHFYNHLLNELSLLLFLIALFTAVLVYKNVKSKLFQAIATLPLIYFSFALFIPISTLKVISALIPEKYVFNFSNKLYYFGMEESSFLPFFLATFHFILLFFILLYVLKVQYQKYAMTFLYFTAFSEGLMMSFAPSIFVSGHRVFLAPDILFLIITSILGKAALADINVTSSVKKIFFCITFFIMLSLAFTIGELQNIGIYY